MKPIKFDLPINNTRIATLKQLQENLTPEILEHFHSGKLSKWLKVRNLNEQANAVDTLFKSDNEHEAQIFKNLIELFDKEIDENSLRTALVKHKELFHLSHNKAEEEIKQLKSEMATYTGQFIPRDNGLVFDTRTHLTWCRYLVGQSWENGNVSGEAKQMHYQETWEYIELLNKNDEIEWRLPTIIELHTIIENYKEYDKLSYEGRLKSPPPVNQIVFPKMPKGELRVWSSSFLTKKGIFSDDYENLYFDFWYNWESTDYSTAYAILVYEED